MNEIRYEIRYTDKATGELKVHVYRGNDTGAEEWSRVLSRENNCQAEVVRGPKEKTSSEG